MTQAYKQKFGLKHINELANAGYIVPDYFDMQFKKNARIMKKMTC